MCAGLSKVKVRERLKFAAAMSEGFLLGHPDAGIEAFSPRYSGYLSFSTRRAPRVISSHRPSRRPRFSSRFGRIDNRRSDGRWIALRHRRSCGIDVRCRDWRGRSVAIAWQPPATPSRCCNCPEVTDTIRRRFADRFIGDSVACARAKKRGRNAPETRTETHRSACIQIIA